MIFKRFPHTAIVFTTLLATTFVASQTSPTPPNAVTSAAADSKSLNDWLLRMHEASKNRSYIGTYVVSIGGQMQSAKIWHVCDGGQQIERVETLTGAPRSSFRHNDKLVTFMPEQKLVRHEKRATPGTFPALAQPTDNSISEFYKNQARRR